MPAGESGESTKAGERERRELHAVALAARHLERAVELPTRWARSATGAKVVVSLGAPCGTRTC